MPNLNWIVPCRRAVVTGRTDYISILDEWQTSLLHHRETICRWYNIDGGRYIEEGRYSDALVQLMEWKLFFCFVGENAALLEGQVTIDSWDLSPFYVRLWKGTLRVLLEEEYPESTPDRATKVPPLQLNENKEVVNRKAQFLVGDVIEFPLHKFLVACGLSQYSNFTFNPSGSFLLGTSLTPPPNENPSPPPIHDNLLGMKFQLLINLSLGAFYHKGYYWKWIDNRENERIVRKRTKRIINTSFSHDNRTSGDARVYSRGMIYAPLFRLIEPSTGRWKICQYHWGPALEPKNNSGQDLWYLPDPRSTRNWEDVDLLTSGWACSPFTLFFSNFVIGSINNLGSDSVNETFFDRPCHQDESRRSNSLSCRDNKGARDWCVLHSQDFYKCISDNPKSEIQSYLSLAFHDERRLSNTAYKCNTIYDIYDQILSMNIVCIINLHPPPSGHEISLVKVFPHSKLLKHDISHKGFLCAYNPVDGSNYINDDENTRDKGKLFFFCADAGMGGLNHRDRLAGVNLHTFKEVTWGCDQCEHNLLSPANRTTIDCDKRFGSFSFSRIDNIFKIQLDNDNITLQRIFNNLFPIVILNRNSQWGGEEERVIGDPEVLYSERAVPFPTMTEAAEYFPTMKDVKKERERREERIRT